MRQQILYLTVLMLLHLPAAQAQVPGGPETVSHYSIAQKRLLLLSTAKFIDLVTVDNLSEDSVRSMACRLTGLPLQLLYTEGFDSLRDPQGVLLLQIAIGYLHKPVKYAADLDIANRYIEKALKLNSSLKDNNLRYESLFLLGDYYNQSGKSPESKRLYLEIVSSAQREDKQMIMARAWQHLGNLKANSDSLNLVYLNNSLNLYTQLDVKEKEIELLVEMFDYHVNLDISLAEKDLQQISALQNATGFKHILYTQYLRAYNLMGQTKYLESLQYALAALSNMQWSGIPSIEASFHMRVGVAYWFLDKREEALKWFRKGLEHRTKETHFFWYKSLLSESTLLNELDRPAESLSLLRDISIELPPLTPWEKMQVASIEGMAFWELKKPDSADLCYKAILTLSNRYPKYDDQFSDSYLEVSRFYVSRGNQKMARIFLKKGGTGYIQGDLSARATGALAWYKMDSLEGNYKAALRSYTTYRDYNDSEINVDERKKLAELTLKYGVEKKDQDIKLLKQLQLVQEIDSRKKTLIRNIMIAVAGLFLIIIGLLFNRYRLKQRTNKKLELQQTEIGEQNIALRHLVKEKDWLVKEVHHRVKNNLQIVMSLLNSQSAFIENEHALTAIHESQHRVNAMSLIHQKLYNSENTATIDMEVYIRELVSYLRDSFNTGQRIRFELDIAPLDLDVSQAVPIGLILNEAITNSIKYAFPDNSKGTIAIELLKDSPTHYFLCVADNGVGMPAQLVNKKPGSLGMSLMAGLSGDLDGTFVIESNGGTMIKIAFVAELDSSRKHAEIPSFENIK